MLFLGWPGYWTLTRSFVAHALSLASNPETLWYSSQSLRGVLLRFFTDSGPYPDGYPDLSIAAFPRPVIVASWVTLSSLVYVYVFVSFWRSKRSEAHLWDALAFVCFSLMESFCMNSGLISLWPAILAAMHVYSSRCTGPAPYLYWAKRAFVTACGFSIIADLTFYRPLQRWTLMLGVHFWVMLALGAGLLIAARAAAERRTVATTVVGPEVGLSQVNA